MVFEVQSPDEGRDFVVLRGEDFDQRMQLRLKGCV